MPASRSATAGAARAESSRADGNLPRRLFAGDVENDAVARELFRRLQQKCRLANSRLAAHERHRTGNEPAAENAIEFDVDIPEHSGFNAFADLLHREGFEFLS